MDDNLNPKSDVDYEAAYQRFLDARKSKKKKIPGWLILASSIAIVLVILVVLVKPWSAFEKKERESVDIYATEPYSEQQYPQNPDDQMSQEGAAAETSGEGVVETASETPAEAQAEIPSEIPSEIPPQEATVPASDTPETAAPETQPPANPVFPDATIAAADTITDQASQQAVANASSEMVVTGNIAQDNAGMLSPGETQQIAALVETGNLSFAGYDFFVVTNNGNDGMGDTQYANTYYKKLINSKKATGNGILIFINGSDMTVNVIPYGTAKTKLGSNGRGLLQDEFVSVYKGGGSYSDAVHSTYYLAQDLLLAADEETDSANSGWTEITN